MNQKVTQNQDIICCIVDDSESSVLHYENAGDCDTPGEDSAYRAAGNESGCTAFNKLSLQT